MSGRPETLALPTRDDLDVRCGDVRRGSWTLDPVRAPAILRTTVSTFSGGCGTASVSTPRCRCAVPQLECGDARRPGTWYPVISSERAEGARWAPYRSSFVRRRTGRRSAGQRGTEGDSGQYLPCRAHVTYRCVDGTSTAGNRSASPFHSSSLSDEYTNTTPAMTSDAIGSCGQQKEIALTQENENVPTGSDITSSTPEAGHAQAHSMPAVDRADAHAGLGDHAASNRPASGGALPPFSGPGAESAADVSDPASRPPLNISSLVSVCLSPVAGMVAVILGIVGLVQIKRSPARGRGLAITGIVVGALQTLVITAGAIIFAVGIGAAASGSTAPMTYGDDPHLDVLWDRCEEGSFDACKDLFLESEDDSAYEEFAWTCGGRTAGSVCEELDPEAETDGAEGTEGPAPTSTLAFMNNLSPGTCFMPSVADLVSVVDCSLLHQSEVFHTFELPEGPFPSEDVILAHQSEQCGPAFEQYVGISYDYSEFEASMFAPRAEGWNDGDRTFLCVIDSGASGSMSSAQGAAR